MKLAFVCSGKPDNLKYLKNNRTEVGSILTSCSWEVIDILLSDIGEFNKRLQEYKKGTVDELVFFYTGHGSVANRQGILKLQLDTTEVSINDILDSIFEHINPKKQAIILDACYSGEFKGIELENNTELLSSSEARRTSFEEEELEQSIFSYYFVEAIKSSKTPLTLNIIAKYIGEQTDKQTPVPLNIGTNPIHFLEGYSKENIMKKDPKHLTSLPPINTNFIGREDDLKAIEKNLSSDNVVCVVNGIGGVGKSELSYKYLHDNKEKYNKIAFIEFIEESRSLEETFYFKFQDIFQLTEKDTLETIIKKLQGLKPKNLMVLDNLQRKEDFNKIKALNFNFDLLITTRAKFDSPNILNLETLNDDDAKELFLDIYETSENIDSILKYLDNHPLFITLTAYSLNEEYIELDELRADIESGKVTEIDSKDDKTFQEHLHDTFDRQFKNEQNSELKSILQILALFPAIEIEFEMLKKIIGDKKLKVKLQKLVARGWLSKKENSYKLHQIIKTFILTSYPAEYEDVAFVLENIGNYIDPDDDVLIASQLSNYIPIIDSLLDIFKDKKDEPIAKILDSNTYLYYSLGEYENSLRMQKKSLVIREGLYDENSEFIAKSYNLLGLIYKAKGDYTIAEQFYKKALKIREYVLGESHLDTAISYNNLATLYDLKREYDKAEILYKKDLKICEDILGKNHLETSISYNNLAKLYNSQGEYAKAEILYEKSLKIKEEILGENHPDTAISYNNLASLYESKGEYNKTEFFFEKSLKIKEEILGKSHSSTATGYRNLGLFYKNRTKCVKAKEYLEKAIASVEELEYSNISLIDLRRELREVEKSMVKEKKAKFNKKGKFCVDG